MAAGSSGGGGGRGHVGSLPGRTSNLAVCPGVYPISRCRAERPELELTDVTRLLPVTKLSLRDALLVLKGTSQDSASPSSFPAAHAL